MIAEVLVLGTVVSGVLERVGEVEALMVITSILLSANVSANSI